MHKSIISKLSGHNSILKAASPDYNLEILRISLKKQMDRKQKLQRLIEKYEQINVQQKSHIKAIKSNIIELKDLESNCKTKFYLNPIIIVDKNLCKDTREYLCMLLNTFYSKYDQNSECEFKTKKLAKQINKLFEKISNNEENLLKIQKQNIGVQVQLQGELLGYKNRLKDETQRQKQLEQENKRIDFICAQQEDKYKQQLSKVEKLRTNCRQLEKNIRKLNEEIVERQMLKKGKEEMMANQIVYQQRFKMQLDLCDEDILKQKFKEQQLKNKIKQKKLKIEQFRAKYDKLLRVAQSMGQGQCLEQNMEKHSLSVQQSHLSLSKIQRYAKVVGSIKSTLQNCNQGC